MKAIVFDYGNVMTHPQQREPLEEIRRELGCDWKRFGELYASQRRRLDRGELDLPGYWAKTLGSAGYTSDAETVARYAGLDMESWSVINSDMVGWIDMLKGAGYRVYLLSNMPRDFYEERVEGTDWFSRFDGAVISGAIGQVKPLPEIYITLLEIVGLPAAETLFLDDLEENVMAAREAGLEAVRYESLEETLPILAAHYNLPIDGYAAQITDKPGPNPRDPEGTGTKS